MTEDSTGSAAAYTSVKGTWAWRAKSAYAGAARGVGRALVAARMLPAEAPSREHRVRHWVSSLTKVHDSLAIAQLGVPWWTYRAIDFVDGWLTARPRPIRVFEWGSGASTFFLASRVEQLYSVEHHEGFASMMRPELEKLANVTFLTVPAPHAAAPRVRSHKAGSEELDFFDYVHAIDGIAGDFDLVVVDGRAREACMAAAESRLADGGLIVFDNTHRQRYQQAIAASSLQEVAFTGLTPTLPYPDRTSILSKPAAAGRQSS